MGTTAPSSIGTKGGLSYLQFRHFFAKGKIMIVFVTALALLDLAGAQSQMTPSLTGRRGGGHSYKYQVMVNHHGNNNRYRLTPETMYQLESRRRLLQESSRGIARPFPVGFSRMGIHGPERAQFLPHMQYNRNRVTGPSFGLAHRQPMTESRMMKREADESNVFTYTLMHHPLASELVYPSPTMTGLKMLPFTTAISLTTKDQQLLPFITTNSVTKPTPVVYRLSEEIAAMREEVHPDGGMSYRAKFVTPSKLGSKLDQFLPTIQI